MNVARLAPAEAAGRDIVIALGKAIKRKGVQNVKTKRTQVGVLNQMRLVTRAIQLVVGTNNFY
jgi:hypothetical protein